MKINITIRADGGQRVGMGHLIRCLSLAQELRTLGCEVLFVSRQDTGIELLKRQGFAVELVTDCPERIQEIAVIKNIINLKQINALIVDSYNVDTDYLESLRKLVYPLAYIDDLNSFNCPADLVVNGNVNAGELGYEPVRPEQVLLLGAEHNLLRRQYCHMPPRQVNHDLTEIMLTTGGSDPYNLIPQFIDWLVELNVRLHIVVGSGFTNADTIWGQQRLHSDQIEVYQNLDDLSALMLKVDLAITSGGSTLYELSACGTPALAYIMAANQVGIVTWLAQRGYIESLGWYHSLTGEHMRDKVIELAASNAKRQAMAAQGQLLVDGYGASRVAKELISLVQKRGNTIK